MPSTRRLISLLACSLLIACEGAVNVDLSATPSDTTDSAILRIASVRLLSDSGNNRDIALADDFDVEINNLGRGGLRRLLDGEDIPAGSYSGIQLLLTAESETLDSYVRVDGIDSSLILRAGRTVRADTSFRIKDDEDTSITLHLDFRSSLLRDETVNGDRELVPRLRLIDNSDAGTLSGDVATALLQAEGCDEDNDPSLGEAVYIFAGDNITPDELDGLNAEPLSTALINRDAAAADYIASFLPAGDYTVAVSCNAELDDPLRDDTISFIATATASVTAGRTTTLNFEAQ